NCRSCRDRASRSSTRRAASCSSTGKSPAPASRRAEEESNAFTQSGNRDADARVAGGMRRLWRHRYVRRRWGWVRRGGWRRGRGGGGGGGRRGRAGREGGG